MPARFPNLLANGTTGIAVGMATNIPPHNMRELINAVVRIIDNTVNEGRETSIDEIMGIIKGPDFPTGAEILGRRGIEEAYRTGHGKIKVRSITNIETLPNGKSQIIVTELPYLVNKARLIERIAELVKEKKLDGITAISDHSNREGMRVCIELRKDVNANVMLNKLYKMTQLQDSFSVNMLALVDRQPRVLNLLQMLQYYLAHQEEVVTRRTKFDLNKAEERAHILEGLLKALDHIDRIIAIIRASANTQEAKANLIAEFAFSDAQAQAIVDMRLRALTGLERQKIENEYKELEEKIAEYKAILGDRNRLLGVIKEELLITCDKFGDERLTKIGIDDGEFTDEDLIPDERTVIAKTNLGYIKRMTLDNFRLQNRGGKGIKGMQTIEEDFIEDLFMTTTHYTLLFFTNTGRVYKLKTYEIPEAGRTARGTAIVNLLQLQGGEKVTAIIPIEKFEDDKYLLMATKSAVVKKTPLMSFANVNKNGIKAITLAEDDDLIEVKFTDGNRDVFMATSNGMCIRFNEADVRSMGRTAAGVRGMRLAEGDEVIGMQLDVQGKYMLCVSENGMGKRTDIDKFTAHHRGGKGISCYKLSEKTGKLVGFKSVEEENEVLIITSQGIIIRTQCASIPVHSRNTSGVKIINVDEGISVAGVAKVRDDEDSQDDAEITENIPEDMIQE